ncbi:MAG: response regulator transcription factor [Anaerolineae bacterium]|nr:response regulator transcription factor [Anaerolineae bacterium]MCX8067439.1 response regulator transcription factor [Anaerolineae bacterium]MDW7991089.1 response regulator transcription factor [Anaerolineae bacterium]
MPTILVVDDEPQIVRLVRAYLEEAGFHVVTASDGEQALYVARHERPDLIILDILMPKMDGLEFTRRIRREQNVPIIMLTARVEETDRIVGLELGADDYVTKPFSPRELVARVRAVLRRVQASPQVPQVLRVGPIVLDRSTHTVTVNGQPVDLTPTEFTILETLMRAPGRAFRRADLLEAVRGIAFDAYERTVDAHIKNLRRKIEPDPSNPRYILTVWGVGYRLNPEMEDA